MIAHLVFARLAAGTSVADMQPVAEALAALRARIPGFVDIASGPNLSPEGLGRGYDWGFVIRFTDAEARDRYLADAEHQRIGRIIVAATEGGLDGLFVFDLQL